MAAHCFTRELRLLTPAHFKRVFEQPVRAGSPYITILARPNDLGYPRIGLAISKKAARKAVQRNLLRRRMRESFRLRQDKLAAADYVIVAKAGVTELSKDDYWALVDKLWRSVSNRCKAQSSV